MCTYTSDFAHLFELQERVLVIVCERKDYPFAGIVYSLLLCIKCSTWKQRRTDSELIECSRHHLLFLQKTKVLWFCIAPLHTGLWQEELVNCIRTFGTCFQMNTSVIYCLSTILYIVLLHNTLDVGHFLQKFCHHGFQWCMLCRSIAKCTLLYTRICFRRTLQPPSPCD